MPFPGRFAAALALVATAAILLTACGDDSSGSTEQSEATAQQQGGAGGPSSGGGQKLPPGAPISQVLARQFPKPKPVAGSPPGTKAAINAGRRACRGKTPVQVREEFLAGAEASGSLNSGQEKMIAELAHYESQASGSPDFVAGQLAAGVYEATLPEKLRIAGYQGCIYEMARRLEKEIAKH